MRRCRMLSTAIIALGAVFAGCGGCSFCHSHDCIGDFNNVRGYIVQCGDGSWSHSGGLQGACSHHDAEAGVTATDSFQSASSGSPTPPAQPTTSTVHRGESLVKVSTGAERS